MNRTMEQTQYPDVNDIDFRMLQSSSLDSAPPFYSEELTQNIPNILIKLFGRKQSMEFYLLKARELAYIFGDLNDFSDSSEYFACSNLADLSIEEPPLNDYELLESLRSFWLELDWENTDMAHVIYCISKLDSRQSLALAYCFGFMPQYKSLQKFYKGLGVNRQLIDSFAVSGICKLKQLLMQPPELGIFETISEVRNFLKELSNYDSKNLIRFSDNKMMGYQSIPYKLAELIVNQESIPYDLLSRSQKLIVRSYKRYYKNTGTFPTHEQLAAETQLAEPTLYKHMKKILRAKESDAEFYRTTNGKTMEVGTNTTLQRIFVALKENPNIVKCENLSELQKQVLQMLLDLKTTDVLPSIGTVAKKLKKPRRRIIELVSTALNNVESTTNIYFENNHHQLSANDIRVQVLNLGGIKYINTLSIRAKNKQMLELLLELQPNTHTFKYTLKQVADLIGAKTNNPERSVYTIVKAILSKENDCDVSLADRRGVALTRNHLRVVELLLQHGLDCLNGIQPEWYYDLAILLLQTDENGRYYEYEYIEQQLGIVSSAISGGVHRIIGWLNAVEG